MRIKRKVHEAGAAPFCGSDIRRIVILGVVAFIVLTFIVRSVLRHNEGVEARGPTNVQVQSQPPGVPTPPFRVS